MTHVVYNSYITEDEIITFTLVSWCLLGQLSIASNLPPVLSRSPKWPPRYSPSCYLARSLSLSLSLCACISSFLTSILSFSLAYDTRIRLSPSVLVRVKSFACAQHARAHARHSPKSILYVSCCVRRHSFLLLHHDHHHHHHHHHLLLLLFLLRLLLTVLASLYDRLLPDHVTKELREKTANVMRTMDSLLFSLPSLRRSFFRMTDDGIILRLSKILPLLSFLNYLAISKDMIELYLFSFWYRKRNKEFVWLR